jgi:hypothetical protein
MSREITVFLKQDAPEVKSPGRRFIDLLNSTVKSPLFVFLFGASLATVYPALNSFFTPKSEIALQRAQEEARADAILIAPFLNNLDASQKGKFEATRAALQALEQASYSTSSSRAPRPMFVAVNRAIEAVAVQISPATTDQVTPAVNQEIERSAAVTLPAAKASTVSYDRLREAIVYIEVDRNNDAQQKQAKVLVDTLRANSVITPGVERLATTTMPSKTQVRYFNDSDRARAEELASIVIGVTGQPVIVVKPKLEAKVGTLELWFGKSVA